MNTRKRIASQNALKGNNLDNFICSRVEASSAVNSAAPNPTLCACSSRIRLTTIGNMPDEVPGLKGLFSQQTSRPIWDIVSPQLECQASGGMIPGAI